LSKEITNDLLKLIWKAVDDKFGFDTVVLKVSEITPMADYFFITSGSNPNQIKAIAVSVEEELVKHKFTLRHSEGMNSANWVLLDFGDIVIHIFDRENREFYDLERVWADAVKLDTDLFNEK